VPYGDITAVVRSQDGAAQYLIGISIMFAILMPEYVIYKYGYNDAPLKFIMRPHTNNFYLFFRLNNNVNETMLYIYSAGKRTL
jgi:hypothetical protein